MLPIHDYLLRIGEYIPDEALKYNCFTGTPVDFIISGDGGIPKGYSILVYGCEGSGKSTALLDLMSNFKVMNPDKNLLYISAEMSRRQMLPFARRFPKFKDNLVLFIGKQEGTPGQTKRVLEHHMKTGWDIVVIDSIAALANKIRHEDHISESEAVHWLTNLISRQCYDCDNDKNIPTTVLAIQQVTKKGDPRGSNTLKHDFDATMEFRIVDKNNPFSEHYITCPKNRYSPSLRLYYNLSAGTDVEYDGERLLEDIERGRAQAIHVGSESDRIAVYNKLKDLFSKK